MKNLDWIFVREFSKISVRNICIDLGLASDYENIIGGKASKEKIHKVRIEIEKRLLALRVEN